MNTSPDDELATWIAEWEAEKAATVAPWIDPREKLQTFPLSQERDDRLVLNLARPERQALTILHRVDRQPRVRVFCRASWRGLGQIAVLPETRATLSPPSANAR